jgi:hypothetical protein
MSERMIVAPADLTDAEIDAVAGGQQEGLVNIDVGNVQVAVPVTAAVDVVANVPGRIGQRN